MNDIINDDFSLLLVISRFGLSLGFGGKTIKETCEANNIHTNTFISVLNFLSESNINIEDVYENISIETLISYLKNAHSYFLDYKLPAIRSRLIEAVDAPNQNIPYQTLFLKFFDDYYDEVQKHMVYENDVVFPYVVGLLSGKRESGYNMDVFEQHHNDIDSKIAELKNILIKYYPNQSSHLLNDVLFDLFSCEKDLVSHTLVENYLFVPLIRHIEQKQEAAS